jgi:hypothetical protein
MVRRHVVEPFDEHRQRDVHEPGKELLECRTYIRPRPGTEIARQQTSVRQLLRGKAPFGGDDERLEQPLTNAIAEEERARLGADRELR